MGFFSKQGLKPQASALRYALSKTFPGKARGTADPSATLGMTKGGVAVPWKADAGHGKQLLDRTSFITLGGPLFHDSFGRDDKFLERLTALPHGNKIMSLQQICHLDRSAA